MTADNSRQSPPPAAAPASLECHQANPQAIGDAVEALTRSISRCEALVTRFDLDIIQIHQHLNRVRPAAEANVVQATHLSTEHRKLLAAMQWRLLLATDQLEEAVEQLMQMKTILLDIMAKAKFIVEELRSGSVNRAAMDELLKLVRSV